MNKRKLIIGSICAFATICFAVIAVLGGGFVFKNIIRPENVETSAPSNDTSIQETIVTTTAKPVNAVPQSAETQPTELTDLLEKSGCDFNDLKNTRQLIVVTGGSGEYYLECYECNNGVWRSTGIKSKAFVGKNGTISADKKAEGDYYSPRGLYSLGFAFGKNKNPGTKMEYRDVYEGVYWVDDADSEYYNKWVDSESHKIQWDSAEKLWTYDEYIYGAVINYNTDPIVKNKGSAIFLHVGYKYTAGCVASDEKTIVEILRWLNPADNPEILIY